MGTHWVKALSIIRQPDENGILQTYHPGDWLTVKNMQLRVLKANGQIEVPNNGGPGGMVRIFEMADCGVVITAGNEERAKLLITGPFPGLGVTKGEGLLYPRTLLWNAGAPLRPDLMPVGFHRLTKGWQVAAPLWRYKLLARDIGDEEDRAITKEMIHDLRVPVYDVNLVYVRRCPDTRRLMSAWHEEKQRGRDARLAFMRALYRVKPVICALPVTWMNGVKP